MSSSKARNVVAFAPFQLDLNTGELTRNGYRIRLQDQSFQILVALLEHPGELVSREQLHSRLWSADTFVDFDHGLNNAIKRLRLALGDTAEKARYVETLPKRGYRFVAPVYPIEYPETGESDTPAVPPQGKLAEITSSTPDARPQTPDAPAGAQVASLSSVATEHTSEAASAPQGHHTAAGPQLRWILWAVAALALAGALAGLVWWRLPHRPRPVHSLAVLPFTNLSGDPSQDDFADAMTDELTSDLGNISALRVISRTSAMHYKKTQTTVPEIARELSVDGVIEGSVVRSGYRVRITAQLIDAPSDRHLWAESYERSLNDVLALQSEIARTIASKVEAVVTPAEQERLHSETVNSEAFEAYVRGRAYLDKWTEEDNALALHSFERAIELDRRYPLAYVGVAESYLIGVSGVSHDEGLRRGFVAINQALALNPEMGEAHAILGQLKLERDWDFRGAEAELKQGIALNPSYGPAHHWYSHLLIDLGRFDQSLAETRTLMKLDPASLTPSGHLAFHYRAAREWDLAIAQYKTVLAMQPGDAEQHCQLGEAYVGKGMYREAVAELKLAAEMARGRAEYPGYLASLGYALARSGDTAGAKRILAELPPKGLVELAYVHAGLGDSRESLVLLTEAWRQHTFSLEANYAVELDPLRSDPGFRELLHRVGLR